MCFCGVFGWLYTDKLNAGEPSERAATYAALSMSFHQQLSQYPNAIPTCFGMIIFMH